MEALLLVLQLVNLGLLAWVVVHYIRVRRRLWILARKMNVDELIDGLLDEPSTEKGVDEVEETGPPPTSPPVSDKRRDRLAALVAGGQAQQYGLLVRGKALTTEQITAASDEDISKWYGRYQALLGAQMTKTLGQAALQLYVMGAARFLPIPERNKVELLHDLEADPFLAHGLNAAACELYHRFGALLCPLTVGLNTIKHCQFERKAMAGVIDDGGAAESRGGGFTATGGDLDNTSDC